jgi:RNA polymerase sigma-70 factor (ECF subfamily)
LFLDLAALLQQAQAGDAAAFDAIFNHFAPPLFRYLYARCGDVDMAEEIASSTWVRAVERLASFRIDKSKASSPEIAFAAWLYRIGHNLLIDAHRRAGRGTVPLDESLEQDNVSIDERVLAAESRQELQSALMQLTPEQREVIVLRFIEEWSTADVARATGRTEGAVKALQHRALATLARLLTTARKAPET